MVIGLGLLLSGCQTIDAVSSVNERTDWIASSEIQSTLPADSTKLADNGPAEVPSGYISFCLRLPDQCTNAVAATTIPLTPENWAALQRVNLRINESIVPEDDQDHYGRAEYWTIPSDGRGDCEDYALAKRAELVKEGYPLAAIRVAVVITERNARHAVLTVTTDKGDYVLDSSKSAILPWNDAGYTWIERQDPLHAWAWVSVRGDLDSTPPISASSDSPPKTIIASAQ